MAGRNSITPGMENTHISSRMAGMAPCKSGNCPRYGKCAAVEFWQGLQAVINEYVDATTIEDLAQKQLRLSPEEYACASRQKNSKVMNV